MWPKVKLYVKKVLIALDQLFNAAAGGSPDETISSRVGKAADAGIWWGGLLRPVIDLIFGKGHCSASQEPDEGEGKPY